MTLSIRARLTLWYSTVVLLVLMTGIVVASFAQRRLTLQRIDDDLARTMATLEGVMRFEFDEGLSLEAAAAEASVEVVVPDRALVLMRSDGSLLAAWGLPIDRSPLGPVVATWTSPALMGQGRDVRIMSRLVDHAGHRYSATVMAPLEATHQEHDEMVRAMLLGLAMALVAAVAGGLIVARQTLKPLARMAEQASGINERDPTERLVPPDVDDELGRLGSSFNELLDRLAASLSLQRQFMADASHELRTPVSVVRTASEVALATNDRPAEEYRHALAIVAEQAVRLSRLVDAMFLLSRADAQGVPLHREFLNLDDVLTESARALRVLADQRRVTVTTDGDEEVGLSGDDGLLRRMVGNLLDNAIRHAAAGGLVVATLERARDTVTLRITNDGPGIDANDRERIFARFVRIGSANGGGLGLPISRWIAEAHGGTLRLEGSGPGRTTFTVFLPCDAVIGRSSGG